MLPVRINPEFGTLTTWNLCGIQFISVRNNHVLETNYSTWNSSVSYVLFVRKNNGFETKYCDWKRAESG